jgi:putative peptide zinc metalloprotease protein
VVESRQWTEVLNRVPGQVEAVLAPSGGIVGAGQPLLKLKNQELDYEIAVARASINEVEARLREAMQNQTPDLMPLNSRLESVTKRLRRLLTDRESLVISSPHEGIWVAPQVQDMVGRWLPRGTTSGLIIDPSGFDFVATVPQEEVDRLFTSDIPGAEIRLKGQAQILLKAGQLRVIPAEQRNLPSPALGWAAGGDVPIAKSDPQGTQAAEPFFEVRTPMSAAGEAAVLHGRGGKIRFDLEPEPLLPRGIRWLRQLLQKRYQL